MAHLWDQVLGCYAHRFRESTSLALSCFLFPLYSWSPRGPFSQVILPQNLVYFKVLAPVPLYSCVQLGLPLRQQSKKKVKNEFPETYYLVFRESFSWFFWPEELIFFLDFDTHSAVFLRVVKFSKGTNLMSKLKIKGGKSNQETHHWFSHFLSFGFPPQPSYYFCLFFMSLVSSFSQLSRVCSCN